VLGVLHTRGPLSQDDLTTLAMDAFPQMTQAQVAQTLQSLQDVELLDGDIVELVRKDASGRWRVRNV
jgi:Fe2+ or Zn2+ uptake regulation protein